MSTVHRRQFLGASFAGLGWLASPRRSWAAVSANQQINLGIVGCGWRGGQLLEAFLGLEGVNIAGLCDPDQSRTGKLAEQTPQAKAYVDVRELLDDNDIDAVVIATCNHWHCLAGIWALEAGKHVYVEKPVSHTLWEGRQLVNAVNRYQKICQVGTQQRSDPMQAEIKQLLHADRALGDIQSVQVRRFGVRKPIGKRKEPLSLPPAVDYNLWLGPAQNEPIYRDELHYDWHWDWNTGSGEMGNWGVHIVDDVRNNVFQDQVAFPTAVSAAGGRYVWDDAGETPNLQLAWLDAGGVPVTIAVCNLPAGPAQEGAPQVPGPGSGYVVHCAGGRLEGRRGGAVVYDETGREIRKFKGDSGASHQRNFIACIREDNPEGLAAPIEVGFHSTEWCNFANIATRIVQKSSTASAVSESSDLESQARVADELQRMRQVLHNYDLHRESSEFYFGPVLRFDDRQERFIGQQAAVANELLRRPDRRPFAVPEVQGKATA